MAERAGPEPVGFRLSGPGRSRARRALPALLVAVTLAGCGNYTPAGVYGYRLKKDEVRFAFRPRRYPWTTFAATGDSVPLRDLRVRRVAVELIYEDGGRERIALREDEGSFNRRVRLGRFRDRAPLGFSFIVNDRFVAEPPREATNRIEPQTPGEPARLRLDLTAAP